MAFLKELISWFFRGRKTDESALPLIPKTISIRPEPADRAPEMKQRPKEPEDNGDGSKTYDILKELKSIEPVSKEFARAREELIQELKKLVPRRRPAK